MTGAQSERGRRLQRGEQWERLPSVIGVLSWGAQPCPAPPVPGPLPQHCQFPQHHYLLHIALPDGPAGSQDLGHLGHDRVVVHAGHGHHLVTPRARQSMGLEQPCTSAAPAPRKHTLERSRKRRNILDPSQGVDTTGPVLVRWDKGQEKAGS